jgi:hypothetical protein
MTIDKSHLAKFECIHTTTGELRVLPEPSSSPVLSLDHGPGSSLGSSPGQFSNPGQGSSIGSSPGQGSSPGPGSSPTLEKRGPASS